MNELEAWELIAIMFDEENEMFYHSHSICGWIMRLEAIGEIDKEVRRSMELKMRAMKPPFTGNSYWWPCNSHYAQIRADFCWMMADLTDWGMRSDLYWINLGEGFYTTEGK